jgi:hypothetical protein
VSTSARVYLGRDLKGDKRDLARTESTSTPTLLREVSAIAQHHESEAIEFEVGSAEALPPDGRFDSVLACTVLDEVDAERGRGELARVARPWGQVAVLVRAVNT